MLLQYYALKKTPILSKQLLILKEQSKNQRQMLRPLNSKSHKKSLLCCPSPSRAGVCTHPLGTPRRSPCWRCSLELAVSRWPHQHPSPRERERSQTVHRLFLLWTKALCASTAFSQLKGELCEQESLGNKCINVCVWLGSKAFRSFISMCIRECQVPMKLGQNRTDPTQGPRVRGHRPDSHRGAFQSDINFRTEQLHHSKSISGLTLCCPFYRFWQMFNIHHIIPYRI